MKIIEVMPNPTGKDAGAEYVVLFNNSSTTVTVVDWQLVDASGKKSVISVGRVSPGGQIKIAGSDLGISLNNSNESIALKDAAGRIVDSLSYTNAPPEGVPLHAAATLTPEIKQLLFDEFTPRHPAPNESSLAALLPAFVAAVILAAVAVYVLQNVAPTTHEEKDSTNL